LIWFQVKPFKIDRMTAGAFGKKNQVIKRMPVRSAKIFMMG